MKVLLKIILTGVFFIQPFSTFAENVVKIDVSNVVTNSPLFIFESGILSDSDANGIIKIKVDNLPTLVGLVSVKKGKVTTHKLIWLTVNTLLIEGSLTEKTIHLQPASESQYIADNILNFGLPDIVTYDKRAPSKPILVYISTTLKWQNSEYLKKVIEKTNSTEKEFWATTKISNYLNNLQSIGYDKSTQQFEHLTAINKNGKSQKYERLQQKFLLIDFSSSVCRPCLEDIDELVDLYKKHQNNLEILTIWDDPKQESWLNIAKKQKEKIIWTSLRDDSGVIFKSFEIDVFPTYVLFNSEGKIIKKWKGSKIKNIEKYL